MKLISDNNEILECDNIFIDYSDSTNLPVVQIIVNDIDPDDSKYLNFIKNCNELTMVQDEYVSRTYKVDKMQTLYLVEYVYDTVQVNINFLIID